MPGNSCCGARSGADYRLVSANPYDTFDEAATLHGQLGNWRFVLDDGRLLATTDESFDSEADARATLEPLLRAWDAVAYLRDQYEVSFVADGVEPSPAPPGMRDRIYMRSNKAYPEPDPDFALTATADRLLEPRWRLRIRDGGPPGRAHRGRRGSVGFRTAPRRVRGRRLQHRWRRAVQGRRAEDARGRLPRSGVAVDAGSAATAHSSGRPKGRFATAEQAHDG